MGSGLRGVLGVREKYGELKGNEKFKEVEGELEGSEKGMRVEGGKLKESGGE